MRDVIFKEGSIVKQVVSSNGHKVGDIFKIVDSCGALNGQLASSTTQYWGYKYISSKKVWETIRRPVYHKDINILTNRSKRKPIVELELSLANKRISILKGELENLNKYKTTEDYIISKIKEVLGNKDEKERIRDILLNMENDIYE